jgi:hypothetical protein
VLLKKSICRCNLLFHSLETTGAHRALESCIMAATASPVLASAAIDAVKQWKCHPYTKDGKVVEVSTMLRVNFSMPGGPGPAGTVGDAQGGRNGGYVVGGVISGIETPAGTSASPKRRCVTADSEDRSRVSAAGDSGPSSGLGCPRPNDRGGGQR